MQVWFPATTNGTPGRERAITEVETFANLYHCRIDDSANQRSADSYVFNIKPLSRYWLGEGEEPCPFTRNNQISNGYGYFPRQPRRVNALCTHGFEYLIRYLFYKGATRVKTGFRDGGDFRNVEEFNRAAEYITEKWADSCTHGELPPPPYPVAVEVR